jgi:hypothetical protein
MTPLPSPAPQFSRELSPNTGKYDISWTFKMMVTKQKWSQYKFVVHKYRGSYREAITVVAVIIL